MDKSENNATIKDDAKSDEELYGAWNTIKCKDPNCECAQIDLHNQSINVLKAAMAKLNKNTSFNIEIKDANPDKQSDTKPGCGDANCKSCNPNSEIKDKQIDVEIQELKKLNEKADKLIDQGLNLLLGDIEHKERYIESIKLKWEQISKNVIFKTLTEEVVYFLTQD